MEGSQLVADKHVKLCHYGIIRIYVTHRLAAHKSLIVSLQQGSIVQWQRAAHGSKADMWCSRCSCLA
jgi:hypothetical protein